MGLDVIPQRQLDIGAASWFRADANSPANNQVSIKAGWAHIAGDAIIDKFSGGDQQTAAFAVVAGGHERWDLITLSVAGAPVITQGTAQVSPATPFAGAPGQSTGPDAPDQFPIAYVHVTETVTVVVIQADITPVSGLVELRRALEGHFIDFGSTGGAPTGSSTIVTAVFAGATSSSGTARGVVTSAPNNVVRLRDQNNGVIKHTSGSEIFGRLTFAAAVWTLTYKYFDAAGAEQTVGNIATDTATTTPTNMRLISVPQIFSRDETARPLFDQTRAAPAGVQPGTNPNPTFGGDAALGDVTIAAPTVLSGLVSYNNLTNTSTITCGTKRALHIRCRGNLDNGAGTISAVGSGFAGGAGNPAGAGAAGTGGGGSAGGGGDTAAGAGGVGGDRTDSFGAGGGGATGGGNATPTTYSWFADLTWPVAELRPGSGGGGGGGGAVPGTPGDGGAGGGIIVLEVLGNLIEGTITAAGAAGGSGANTGTTTHAGGGGGGGGGDVMAAFAGTRTPGTVTAAGGAGGTSIGGTGGGGAGEAGRVRRCKVAP